MGGDTVDKEGSNREQMKQRRALMCFVPPLAKKMEHHHQTMATMEPHKCGEVITAHHLEEVGRIVLGGNAVEKEGSNREQSNQTRALMWFNSPFAKNWSVIIRQWQG
jgi:hypothetical protein